MISILILSWNRPLHLFLTLSSLKRVLRNSDLSFEMILLDQNSNFITRKIISFFSFNKCILLNENIGMAKGWSLLFKEVNNDSKYVLQLENDWWCNTKDSLFLKTAETALKRENCAFIKLRKNFDFQAGVKLINKEPQTIYPIPFQIFKFKEIGKQYCFYSESKFSCFTFNPTLMKIEFRDELENYYVDNLNSNLSILRSGEDIPTEYWENQNNWVSGIITNPPFVHTGFHSRRYIYLKMPIFCIIEGFWWITSLFRNKTQF